MAMPLQDEKICMIIEVFSMRLVIFAARITNFIEES